MAHTFSYIANVEEFFFRSKLTTHIQLIAGVKNVRVRIVSPLLHVASLRDMYLGMGTTLSLHFLQIYSLHLLAFIRLPLVITL
jgi:hypothetical protein